MATIISDAHTDKPPTVTETGSKTAAICAFPGCTNEIIQNGPGRPPKYCPEHRGTKDKKPTGVKTATTPAWAQAKDVETALTNLLEGISWGVGFLNADDALILATGGPAIVHELVELGRVDKTWRKYLTYIASPGKYGPLLMAVSGVILPIAINHNLIPQLRVNTEGVNS